MFDASEEFERVFAEMRAGNIDALELLSGEIPGFPDGRDRWVGRAWITTAIHSRSVAAVRWMLSKNVLIIFRDDEGYTVLHSCMDEPFPERLEMLSLLIEHGADVNLKGINDWTPLHMAISRGDLAALKRLLLAGADRTIKTEIDHYLDPVEEAKRIGFEKALKIFRETPIPPQT